ncbi:hypothetical protein ACFQ6Q_00130 [Streptomyces sp. NPDC056437]|uniref:hypothetical protein n=1 Tax=Streptomyces sp. NPDC056437 TaxID=3345816 RepID=UPI0036809FC2
MPGFFELAEPAAYADTPDDAEYGCPCPAPDDQYLLEIDEGSVLLTHKTCGKSPRGDWWQDCLSLMQSPVTLAVVPYGGCDGSEWHGEYRCDCGVVAALALQPVGQVTSIELVIQSRKTADDPWRDNGGSIPGMFTEDAERLLAVTRRAWPDSEHRLIRRTTSILDEEIQ